MIGQVITYYNHVLIKYYKIEKPRGQSLKIKQHGSRPKMARHGNTGAMGLASGRRGAGARMAPRDPAFFLDAGTSALPKNPGRHICVRQRPMRSKNRSTEGCSKLKSPETRQVQEILVSTLEHLQAPKWDRTRCPEE